MAATSTTFTAYVRPRVNITVSAGRRTSVVAYIPYRSLSGIYVGAGLQTDDAAASPKSMLPGPRTPLGYVDGDRNKPVYIDEATWYRLIDYILNKKLGGIAAPTIADVAATVTTVQEAVTSTVTTVSELNDQAVQNAAVLSTVREVALNNDLAGAEQIDNPVLQRKGIY